MNVTSRDQDSQSVNALRVISDYPESYYGPGDDDFIRNIQIVGEYKNQKAVKPLINILHSVDPYFEAGMYEAIIDALVNIKGEDAFPFLIDMLCGDDYHVDYILQTLKKSGTRAVSSIENALFNADGEIRERAADILNSWGWKPSDDSKYAAYLVAKHKWKEAIKYEYLATNPFLLLLNDHAYRKSLWIEHSNRFYYEWDVDIRIIELLSEICDPRALGDLAKFDSQENSVNLAVINAIGLIGKKITDDKRYIESINLILELTDEQQANIEAAIKRLLVYFGSLETNERLAAVKAMVNIGDYSIPFLETAMNNPDSLVRRCVIYTLDKMLNPESVTILIEAMDDDDDDVQGIAQQILSSLLKRYSMKRLMAVVDNQKPAEREQYLSILKEIKKPSSWSIEEK